MELCKTGLQKPFGNKKGVRGMKKLATLTLAAALVLAATGCAKPVMKQWQAAGGSRADATVEVGFIYNPQTERPEASDEQAYQEAVRRCKAWGYADAEPFGLVKDNCQNMAFRPFVGYVCEKRMVTRQFQCLGQGNVTHRTEMNSDAYDIVNRTNEAFFKAGKSGK